jgi:arylsulfatase A-like enzyme
VELLAQSGYHCVNIGKMHTFPYETPLGFHERFVVENKDRYLEGRYFFDRWDMALQARGLVKQQRELYRLREDYHERLGAFEWEIDEDMQSDQFVGNLASWWIRHKPNMEPVFLEIGFPGPHPPFDPTAAYAQPYMDKELPLPEFTEEEWQAMPKALQELIDHHIEIDHDSVVWQRNPTREQLHRLRAYYYANVTMIDQLVGQLMDSLREKGMLENSVIIFTSDHGENLGDHGLIQKWSMYDVVTKVPLIVWNPDRFPGGRRIEGLCQHFDIAPAILQLAGITPPSSMHAESLLPALQGDAYVGRDYVVSEHARDKILTGTEQMTMIRDQQWKLVHYVDDTYGELYDLHNDPGEKHNLWNDPAAQDTKGRMLDQLLRWSIRSQLRSADWAIPWR